jgi:hypothetical protein
MNSIGEKMINHEKKFIHIPIPKTASQALVKGLGMQVTEEPALYHNNLEHFISENYLEHMNYFKFSIVRNPWDKLASLWRDFTGKRGHQYSEHHRCEKRMLSEFKNYEDLCLNLENSIWSQNLFFKPQVYYLSYAGEIGADYVGRFESLTESYREICSNLNMQPQNLHTINNSLSMTRGSKDYRSWYTEKSAQAVYDLYKLDVENFNYEF